MDKKNKKLIAVSAVVLFAVGAIIGWLIMGAYLRSNPDAGNSRFTLIYYIVASAVPALILSLSVKPIVYLFKTVIEGLKKLFLTHSPMAVAGAFLGVVLGLILAILVYAVLTQFIKIYALNLIITIFVGVGASIVCAIACSKSLTQNDEDEETVEETYNGYLLTYSAFFNDKVLTLPDWLNCKLNVLKSTVDKLISDLSVIEDDSVKNALKNYDELNKAGALKSVDFIAKNDTENADIAFAKQKHLKIIVNGEAINVEDEDVKILSLSNM